MNRLTLLLFTALIWLLPLVGLPEETRADDVIVIAHRGASGYFPEHTLAAYHLAMEQGADFVEPDLVITKDHHLVCLHDVTLGRTTNVAEMDEFRERKRTVNDRHDWFVSDFTLSELKKLRTRQSYKGRSKIHDDSYEIPTFVEMIDLVHKYEQTSGRKVGIYPELKAPQFFEGIDFPKLVLDTLKTKKLGDAADRIYLQSFDESTLRQLDSMTDLPLVMLLRPRSRTEPDEPNIPLKTVAEFADAVGAHKFLVLGYTGRNTGFIAEAGALGLPVHVWTVRDDQLHPAFDDIEAEISALVSAGTQGLFTDFPDTAVNLLSKSRYD